MHPNITKRKAKNNSKEKKKKKKYWLSYFAKSWHSNLVYRSMGKYFPFGICLITKYLLSLNYQWCLFLYFLHIFCLCRYDYGFFSFSWDFPSTGTTACPILVEPLWSRIMSPILSCTSFISTYWSYSGRWLDTATNNSSIIYWNEQQQISCPSSFYFIYSFTLGGSFTTTLQSICLGIPTGFWVTEP